MNVAERLYETAKQLPESIQIETLHYLEYLGKDYLSTPQTTKNVVSHADKSDFDDDNQRKLFSIMQKIANQDTAFSDVDVLAWQKEQRQDNPLPNRD